MRKVTKQIAEAFAEGVNKTVGNTTTTGFSVFLHGNKIVEMDPSGNVYMSLAGWNTPTTRERLNGIAEVLGLKARFYQKNFTPYLNGEVISSYGWQKVN
tara:strand:+ start:82 stop:378 length:297 start_codon:yes stop_codon:yes gene_type:complete